jgi:hypothetical protein
MEATQLLQVKLWWKKGDEGSSRAGNSVAWNFGLLCRNSDSNDVAG